MEEPTARRDPLQNRLSEKHQEVLTLVDLMEENAMQLCGDLCELRLRLMWEEGMQEKINVADRLAS